MALEETMIRHSIPLRRHRFAGSTSAAISGGQKLAPKCPTKEASIPEYCSGSNMSEDNDVVR
jgi:hypothetical protein